MALARCWKRVALCIVGAGTLVAACGDDESSAPATTLAPPTTLSQVQLDRQKADRAVLTAADVPGYTVDPPGPDDESPELKAAANACVNNNPVLGQLGKDGDPRGANGPDFSKGEQANLTSSVTFAETEEEARSAITDAGVASFPTCFSRALTAALRAQGTFTNPSVTTAKLPAFTVGDGSLGYRSTARARVGGAPVTLYFDATFIRSGRGVAVIDGFTLGSPFPETERIRLATLLAQRMAA